jgi:hypothetical protein
MTNEVLTASIEAITLLDRLADSNDLTESGRDILRRTVRRLEERIIGRPKGRAWR